MGSWTNGKSEEVSDCDGKVHLSRICVPRAFKDIEAVNSFPTPVTKKHVRTFLGITGYYRRFIPDYGTTAALLTDLIRKNCPN